MKVGGNVNALEFFRQHGTTNIKDAKSKYSSKAAQMYKEKLRKLADEDARKLVAFCFVFSLFLRVRNENLT